MPTGQREERPLSPAEKEHLQHKTQLRDKLRSDLAMFAAPNISAKERGRLQREIIATALATDPPPATDLETDQLSKNAWSTLRSAHSASEIAVARDSFRSALRAAPWYAPAYAGLSSADEKLGDYAGAEEDLRFYMLAAPQANDLNNARAKIAQLAELEKSSRAKPAQPQATAGAVLQAITPQQAADEAVVAHKKLNNALTGQREALNRLHSSGGGHDFALAGASSAFVGHWCGKVRITGNTTPWTFTERERDEGLEFYQFGDIVYLTTDLWGPKGSEKLATSAETVGTDQVRFDWSIQMADGRRDDTTSNYSLNEADKSLVDVRATRWYSGGRLVGTVTYQGELHRQAESFGFASGCGDNTNDQFLGGVDDRVSH